MGRCFSVINNIIEKVLVSEEEIVEIVGSLADRINADYRSEDKNLVVVSVLKGAMPFTTDLMKKLNVPCELECVRVSSYGSECFLILTERTLRSAIFSLLRTS